MTSLATYFIHRLQQLGVKHAFSLSGDYITPLLQAIDGSSIARIGNATEQDSAYAAVRSSPGFLDFVANTRFQEGYAKTSNVPGLVITTYGSGTLCCVQSITSSFVEGVPVILVNGAPTRQQFLRLDRSKILAHHTIDQGRRSQFDIFRPITVSAHIIDVPELAPYQIDEALVACITYQQPVYLEICVDQWDRICFDSNLQSLPPLTPKPIPSIPENVKGAVGFALSCFEKAKKPLIWAGAEIKRSGAQDIFLKLLIALRVPYATSLDAKGIIDESSDQFVGVLDAGFSTGVAEEALKVCDFLVVLGVWFEDLRSFAKVAETTSLWIRVHQRCVQSSESTGRTLYEEVALPAFVNGLLQNVLKPFDYRVKIPAATKSTGTTPAAPITYDSFTAVLQSTCFWKTDPILVVDITLALFSVAQLPVKKDHWINEFLWGSIGWACGGAVGVKCALAHANKRVVVVIGDGGLQNHPLGLSAMAQLKHDTVVIVLVNNSYAIDQFLVNPKTFNTTNPEPYEPCNLLPQWDYVKLAQSFGGNGFKANNNKELSEAIEAAAKVTDTFSLVVVPISDRDLPAALREKPMPSLKLLGKL